MFAMPTKILLGRLFQRFPEPAISILLDSVFLFVAAWLFSAYLYFTIRNGEETVAHDVYNNTKDGSSLVAASATTNIGKRAKSLQRLLVMRLQIIASILTSMVWSSDVPQFLIDSLNFITGFFTLKISGLLTSLDCVGSTGMTPFVKWQFSLGINCCVMIILSIPFLWWKIFPLKYSYYDKTVKAASLQVFFIWMFENLVTTCFRIFDCTGEYFPVLLLDPNIACIHIWAYQLVGGLILFVYLFVPYGVFALRTGLKQHLDRCCCCFSPVYEVFGWFTNFRSISQIVVFKYQISTPVYYPLY